MISKLDEIIREKQKEVSLLRDYIDEQPFHEIATYLVGEKVKESKSLIVALTKKGLSIITEIKRKSPAKGNLAEITNPVTLAKKYVEAGSSALSILTDRKFFGGSPDDLQLVAAASFMRRTPILRKDFIIDRLQIAEAAYLGADAILCIVAALGKRTKEMVSFAHELGLEVLVEVHDESELDIALNSGSNIIGVNNRDLKTLEVDVDQAIRIYQHIPESFVTVAESGILQPELARKYRDIGFDGVLIGEALVISDDPESFIKQCIN